MEYRHTLPIESELIGEFKILGLLGSGGFANTYLAHDLTLGREVAIKEYFPAGLAVRAETERVQVKTQSDEKQFRWGLNRFVREAKTLAKFRHPSVVRVFRVFDANDTAYIVLEFVRGANMETWLRNLERRPTQDELDTLLPPLLDALEVVHSAGILHRDIKPANIYIREVDHQPVLLDFGAARYAIGDMAGTTAAIVSKGYSPHEAYSTDGRMQGPWTDIYGLAATLYRSLSGSAPPESTGRVLVDECGALSDSAELAELYRPEFLSAIDRGLAIMPQSRPQSIGDWRQQLFPGLAPVSVPDAASLPEGGGKDWRPISDQPSDQPSDATEAVSESITSNPVLKRLSSPSYAARMRSGSGAKVAVGGATASTPSAATRFEPASIGGSQSGAQRSGPSAPLQPPQKSWLARNVSLVAGVALLATGAAALITLGVNSGGERQTAAVTSKGSGRETARAAAEAAEKAREERLAMLAAREAEQARHRADAERARKRDEEVRARAEAERLRREREAERARKLAAQREEIARQRQIAEEARQARAREQARKRAEAERLLRESEAAAARKREEERQAAEEAKAEREREAAEAREREEARKRAEAEREREEEAKRLAEQKRLEREAEERRLAEERQREREAAIARRQAEQRRSAEAERLRLASEAAAARAREEEQSRLKAETAREKREMRLAALDTKMRLPSQGERKKYVKEVQKALQGKQCYAGPVDGDIEGTQLAMVAAARSHGDSFRSINLARATSNDYETWLDWMRQEKPWTCPLVTPQQRAAPQRATKSSSTSKPRTRRASVQKKRSSRPNPKKVYRKKPSSSGGGVPSRDSLLRSER